MITLTLDDLQNQAVVAHTLIPALGRQKKVKRWLSEFKVSLVYRVPLGQSGLHREKTNKQTNKGLTTSVSESKSKNG